MQFVYKYYIHSLLIFSFAVSCSKPVPVKIPRLVNTKLISDRGIDYDQGVVLLRLKRPPLLKTATKDANGKIIIDENEKNALIAEQEELLGKLKKISPKIKLIYTYKLSFNGLAVAIPAEFYGDVFSVEGIASSYKRELFDEIEVNEIDSLSSGNFDKSFNFTTADFIGARQSGLTGKGVKIAIFDTGIDYTHSMFNGPGLSSVFNSIDPKKETKYFPNSKVVGGIDLVGEDFQAWSLRGNAVPKQDNNPIDTRGHGTHVAGTAAGIGDGVNTFDGIAPDAELYAIKVFANGGTGDDIVIAGIEWCLDPNGDYDLSDRIHVGNMSLGGRNGRSYSYYNESVRNAAIADFIVVASAGNDGAVPYIVGSPSTVSAATSVGATIGGMEYLWKTDKVATISSSNIEDIVVELVEGTITRPTAGIGKLSGELVYVGLANVPLTSEQREKVKGKIALVDRGGASFIVKMNNVRSAGAVGAVVVNNIAGADPIAMGGEGKVSIPGIMVTSEVGDMIKNQLSSDLAVSIEFNSDDVLEKSYLIDNITRFSSQGPTVDTAAFKPEIVAPGYQVISARRGSGNQASRLNGTSMSAPQVTGAYALLRQAYPQVKALDLKAMMVGSATPIKNNKTDERYLLSRQGAGRVQFDKALQMKAIARPATVSMGFIQVAGTKTFKRSLELVNLSNEEVSYDLKFVSYDNVTLNGPESISLKGNETKSFDYDVVVTSDTKVNGSFEINGDIQFFIGGKMAFHTPVLAIAKSLSTTSLSPLRIEGENGENSFGARSSMIIENTSEFKAVAEIFNLVELDDKKVIEPGLGIYKTRECDLQALGMRLVERENKEFVQFGVKIYNPTSIWDICEVSVLFDLDDDGIADYELGGLKGRSVTGLSDFVTDPNQFVSAFVNANEARAIRMNYESALRRGESANLTYKKAILGTSNMWDYSQSTVAVVEVDKTLIPLKQDEKVKIRVATLAGNPSDVDSDDYLGVNDKWHDVSLKKEDLSFQDLPSRLEVSPQSFELLEFTKGNGNQELVIFVPTNESVLPDNNQVDNQMFIVEPNYLF